MNIPLKEKLQLLGYQLWTDKEKPLKKSNDHELLFFLFSSTLLVFSKKEIDDLEKEFFNRFVTSIKISINSDEDYLPLDKFPLNKTIIKIISFGDFNKDFMKDSNLKDLVPVNSLEGFFDNPSHKKELWRNLSH
jgi:hypothetical protein|tara:strand:+ start:272 stop:673 length:402 start_codon:yes stop_codon:yes gene_type:complete